MASNSENILQAKILKRSRPYLVPGKFKVTEWSFSVPLKHDDPSGEQLRLFARSAEKAEAGHIHDAPASTTPAATGDKDAASTDAGTDAGTSSKPSSTSPSSSSSSSPSSPDDSKPWLFYLQGGPGFGASPPQDTGFTRFFLDKGYRVMLLDQRGTGQSSTVTARTLKARGGEEPRQRQADFLKLLRADNIVRDVEAVRRAITADMPEASEAERAKKRIALLGQSFGGFCSVSYLSMFPEGLREVFLAGGLPPVGKGIDDVYGALVRRAAERSGVYYEKYPEDKQRVKAVLEHLNQMKTKNEPVTTGGGVNLTEARVRALGIHMGFHGGMTRVHNLIARMENDLETHGFLTRPTLSAFENTESYDDAPLYALVHEILYLDGPGQAAGWSAERALKASPAHGKASEDQPLSFSAEMITHDTFSDHPEIRDLIDTAEILASDKDWPRLYNEEKLSRNKVPVFAAVYFDDLYVDFNFSMETASKIRGCKTFITNRMYHDGIRSDTNKVLEELFALRDDTLD